MRIFQVGVVFTEIWHEWIQISNRLKKITLPGLQHISLHKVLLLPGMLFCTLLLTCCTSYVPDADTTTTTSTIINAHIAAFPIASSGCGKVNTIVPGTTARAHLLSGGLMRLYSLHIPSKYRNTQQHPLVLNFHGHGSTSLQQEGRTDFSQLADRYGIIVAYPQGVVGPDHHTGWDTGPARNPQTNDLLFVSNLLNHLQSTLCIDPTRIYATGFSNGGGMTNELACKMADRIAAFAPVSGAYPQLPGGCNPARPVPILEIHGTLDQVVPYNGSPVKGYPPITQWLQSWVQRDGCKEGPIIFTTTDGVTGERWQACRDDVTIVHYAIHGLGHTWPVAHDVIIHKHHATTTFDATNTIWAFFQDHTLPQQPTTSASKLEAMSIHSRQTMRKVKT
jgi:polyhydroxybutyrate depolymerase